MPTETVYGIAADATNARAVQKTFDVKGRPADNPLIVHVAHLAQAEELVTQLAGPARALAEAFWPGPLTIVLPKRAWVPDAVTAGLDTVAVRIPDHPVALRLIDEVGRPLSAPSANPFMGLSPTRAEDVEAGLAAKLAMVLDGGACTVGLESTVVDFVGEEFRVLRPGAVTRAMLAEVVAESTGEVRDTARRSPGLYPRHYAPKTKMILVESLSPDDAGLSLRKSLSGRQIQMPSEPGAYGVSLYASLHRLDAQNPDRIAVERPPTTPEWEAVWDRLRKASGEA
jgi:L-threonylcarbamoyladenylate synthase